MLFLRLDLGDAHTYGIEPNFLSKNFIFLIGVAFRHKILMCGIIGQERVRDGRRMATREIEKCITKKVTSIYQKEVFTRRSQFLPIRFLAELENIKHKKFYLL